VIKNGHELDFMFIVLCNT